MEHWSLPAIVYWNHSLPISKLLLCRICCSRLQQADGSCYLQDKDKKSWQVLKAKGHPCSRNDRYAALYHPAHLLGVETGTSVLAAALMKHATGGGNLRPLCDLCGRAVRDLPKGTVLDMGGHHHTIDGVEGVLNPAAAIGPDAALPFYLLSHRTLCRDVPAGKLITLGDLDMPEESTLLRLRREQDKAFGLVK